MPPEDEARAYPTDGGVPPVDAVLAWPEFWPPPEDIVRAWPPPDEKVRAWPPCVAVLPEDITRTCPELRAGG